MERLRRAPRVGGAECDGVDGAGEGFFGEVCCGEEKVKECGWGAPAAPVAGGGGAGEV